MKVLIIEDEQRAASHLERLLKKAAPEMEVSAILESVRDAVEYLGAGNMPDLIFSDIQLSDGISFDIYTRVKVSCPIIFTTAWDHYTMEAFSTNGIDYLLKPIEEERLLKAIHKAEQLSVHPMLEKIMQLAGTKVSKSYKTRFIVKIADKIKTIPTEEILLFYSLEKATYLLTTANRSYCIDYALDQLETMLDPDLFFRMNRKYIVSVKACSNITAWSNSRLKIQIDGLKDHELIVARERVQDFREWLDR